MSYCLHNMKISSKNNKLSKQYLLPTALALASNFQYLQNKLQTDGMRRFTIWWHSIMISLIFIGILQHNFSIKHHSVFFVCGRFRCWLLLSSTIVDVWIVLDRKQAMVTVTGFSIQFSGSSKPSRWLTLQINWFLCPPNNKHVLLNFEPEQNWLPFN